MATDAMSDKFRTYLETCSEGMASQIMSTLQQVAARRPVPNAAPGMAATSSAVAKPEKKQRKKAKSEPVAVGPKRPLNSWMAYRKFYNRLLASYTQKSISKCLTILWRADLFEGKWSILAKAYSIVRGCREKKDAPLDEFFAICAPLIGVIPPEEYLQRMGWQLSPPQDGDQDKMPQIIRLFTPSLDTFPEKFTTTTLSADDLVNHCYAMGYGKASNNDSQNASTHGSLTMVSKPTATTTNDKDETTHMSPFAQTDTILAFNAATHGSSTGGGLQQAAFGGFAISPPSSVNNADPSPLSVASAAGQATLEQAASVLEQSGVEFPYNGLFDPAVLPSQFNISFNPAAPNTAVEDDGRWDAFDPSMSMAQNEMSDPLEEMLNWDFINEDMQ
uniref:Mating-type protein MAT-1 n=2 Tax=Pseudocercospora musae TaxID=113226 RepID=D2X8Q6_9PEZI|nr:mating-type 1-1 protein [Pseudocercospora musae]